MKPSIPFDIIVFKNGRVSGDVHAYPESFSFTKTPFITAVREITDNRQWLRTVYDDFDTVNIPGLHFISLWMVMIACFLFFYALYIIVNKKVDFSILFINLSIV